MRHISAPLVDSGHFAPNCCWTGFFARVALSSEIDSVFLPPILYVTGIVITVFTVFWGMYNVRIAMRKSVTAILSAGFVKIAQVTLRGKMFGVWATMGKCRHLELRSNDTHKWARTAALPLLIIPP